MEKKDIQEQRMKRYFIDACKSIIRGEGIKAVSVRRVAEEAGYSYATLYNYFEDLKDLLFVTVQDFLEECRSFIMSGKHPEAPGRERLVSLTESYVRYFIQYPGTFDLMFLEKMSDISTHAGIANFVYTFPDDLLEEDWAACFAAGDINVERQMELKQIYKTMLFGSLLFYLNRRIPKDYPDFVKLLRDRINYLLDK